MADIVLERALHEALGAAGGSPPPHLAEALAYAVFPGGGRVRPRLCLEVERACGTTNELAYAATCSVELLHCASLVHDDLPCFDAGAMRRGKPSVHRAFGEATAVLVGDGLMVQSFYTLARAVALRPEVGVYPVLALLEAAGPRVGLVAGQAWELEKQVDLAAYHRGKTASLFEVSAALGALANGAAPSPFVVFGRAFGMAYQLDDDVADALADASSLGKPTGKDRELGRPTAMRDVPSADVAIERMVAAARAATEAVPSCPGEGDLRRFVDAVFNALVARCLHARAEEPDRAKLSA
ncbi:polyprenyl synthetase family protein [soil metagenome]